MIEAAIHWLFGILALPEISLTAVFIVSFISATLLPLGSEPLVFAVIKANPLIYWQVILVATIGNTLGGVVSYGMGYYTKKALVKERDTKKFRWLAHHGAKAMLMAWLRTAFIAAICSTPSPAARERVGVRAVACAINVDSAKPPPSPALSGTPVPIGTSRCERAAGEGFVNAGITAPSSNTSVR